MTDTLDLTLKSNDASFEILHNDFFASRKYGRIWAALKTNLYVRVVVSDRLRPTLIQAVKKLKCEENAANRFTGGKYWSKMSITRTPDDPQGLRWVVEFRLVDERIL